MEALAVLLALVALAYLAIAPLAFFMVLATRTRVRVLEARAADLESELFQLRQRPPARRENQTETPLSTVVPLQAPVPPAAHISKPERSPQQVPPRPDTLAKPAPAPMAAQTTDAPTSALPPQIATAQASAQSPRAPAPPPHAQPTRPAKPISLESAGIWVLSGVGGLGLLVAAIYAYSLAVEAGLIGPAVRYAGGLTLGIAGLVLAELLWSREYRLPAAGVAGGAIGGLYAALYAGHSLYGIVSMTPTFGLMFGVTVVAVLLAHRRDSQFVAILGLLGGFLTPVLLSTGQNKALALFSYMAMLNAGLLLVSRLRGWWVLTALAVLATFGLHLGWGVKFAAPDQVPIALIAATGLALLFWATAIWPRTPKGVQLAAFGAMLVAPLTAIPHLVPEGSTWVLEETQSLDTLTNAWLAVGFLVVISILGQSLAARRRWPELGMAAALFLLPGLAAFSIQWLDDFSPEPWAPLFTASAVVLLAIWWIWANVQFEPESGQPRATPAWAVLTVYSVVFLCSVPLMVEGKHDLLTVGLPLLLAATGWAITVRPGPSWAAVVGAFMTGAALLATMNDHPDTTLLLGLGLFVAYLVAPFVLHALPRTRHLTGRAGPWLASALMGPAVFLALHEAWQDGFGESAIGFLPLALGAGTLLAALQLQRKVEVNRDRNLTLYVAVSLLFACVAVPLQLGNEWLTVGWALEAAALAWLATRLKNRGVVVLSTALYGIVAVRLLLNPEVFDYHSEATGSIINWTLYGYGIPLLAVLAGLHWTRARRARFTAPEAYFSWFHKLPLAYTLLAITVAFALINLEVSEYFGTGGPLRLTGDTLAAGMVRSLCWALFGLALLVPGRKVRWMRGMALGFLLLAALKVFLFDLRNLSGIVRVGSLFGVAVVLILAALALQKLVLSADKDEARRKEDDDSEDDRIDDEEVR